MKLIDADKTIEKIKWSDPANISTVIFDSTCRIFKNSIGEIVRPTHWKVIEKF